MATGLELSSYRWGVSVPASRIGSEPFSAKPAAQDFLFTAPLGTESIGIFSAVASGARLDQLVLVSFNGDRQEIARWTLRDVQFTSYSPTIQAGEVAQQSFTVNATEVAVQYTPIAQGQAGVPLSASYDFAAERQGAIAAIVNDGLLQAPPADAQFLSFNLNGDIALNSFQWSAILPVASNSSGSTTAKALFDDFQFTANLSQDSPGLFSALVDGSNIDQISFVTTDRLGRVSSRWDLGSVLVTSYRSTGELSNIVRPLDSFSLNATAVTKTVFVYASDTDTKGKSSTATWNLATNQGTGSGFGGVDLLKSRLANAQILRFDLNGNGVLDANDGDIAIADFSWSASNTGVIGSGGAGTGKVQFSDFQFNAIQSLASPALFRALASGQLLQKVSFVTTDAQGRISSQWDLGSVLVTSYAPSDAAADDNQPAEVFNLNAVQVSETVFQYQSSIDTKGQSFTTTWNVAQNGGSGVGFGGDTLLQAGTANAQVLRFDLNGNGTIDDTNEGDIRINNFSWQVSNPPMIGSGGSNSGKPQFGDFRFTAAQSKASPGLLRALTTGQILPKTSFVTTDAQGRVSVRWDLESVAITAYAPSDTAADGVKPNEQFSLTAAKVTETVFQYRNTADTQGQSFTALWDLVENKGNEVGFGGDTLAIAGTASTQVLRFDLNGNDTIDNTNEGDIRVHSFSWNASKPALIGSGGGSSTSKPQFDDFVFSADQSKASPGLFNALAKGTVLDKVSFVSTNARGLITARWDLEGVVISSYLSSDEATDGSKPSEMFNLSAQKVTQTVFQYQTDTQGQAFTTTWDLALNAGNGVGFGGRTLAIAGTANAQVLRFDINGNDTIDNANEGDIAINHFSWNASNSLAGGSSGGGSGSGKVQFSAFSFSTIQGLASPGLLRFLTRGEQISKVNFFTTDAQGRIASRWDLEDVFVTTYNTLDEATDGVRATDSFNLDATKVTQTIFQYRDSTDTTGQSFTATWDLAKNTGTQTPNFGSQTPLPKPDKNLLAIGSGPYPAVIGGTPTATVTEDTNLGENGQLTATGNLWVADINPGESKFKTLAGSAPGNLGSLTLTEAGAFRYSVDNILVNFLGAGKTQTDRFTVTSFDGTASQVISITTEGVNDAPIVELPIAASVTENDAPITLNLLNGATDFDEGDRLSVSNLTLISGNAKGITLENDRLTFNPNAYDNLSANATRLIQYGYNIVDGQGGSTAQTATITIQGVNDAPNLNSTLVQNFPSILPPPAINRGVRVARLLGTAVADADRNALQGIAVYRTLGDGRWQYSNDNGVSWIRFDEVSPTAALLLSAETRVRFRPTLNSQGFARIRFVAWDQTSGVSGSKVNLGTIGGTTAFSAQVAASTVIVEPLIQATQAIASPTVAALTTSLSSRARINPIIGSTGNDRLIGGVGADTFTGGMGADTFVFSSPDEGIDQITDFSVTEDIMEVSAQGFGGSLIANRALAATQFAMGSAAQRSSDRFIYNNQTGALFFDVDGNGGVAEVQIATLSTGLAINHQNILIRS